MAVFVWEGYRIYAGCIFVLSAASILLTVYETRSNNEQIRRMARYVSPVQVLSQDEEFSKSRGTLKESTSDRLVPGDVIKVPEG